jgi:integrase
VPSDADVNKLLELARAKSTDGLARAQDWVMLVGYKNLLARRAELFKLKRSEIDFEGRKLGLWTRKRRGGNLELDWMPMTSEVFEAFTWWDQARPIKADSFFVCLDDTPLARDYYGQPFQKRNHWMPRLCEEASVTEFGIHGFRHWGAVRMLKSGRTIAEIQRALRHMNPRTTEIYLRQMGEFLEETRQAMEAALTTPGPKPGGAPMSTVKVRKASEKGGKGRVVQFRRAANE